MTAASVFIAGPASWNDIIVVDRLPEAVPHMQFAQTSWSTVGGTSAGKALSLAALGRPALLAAATGDDDPGRRIRDALAAAGVDVRWSTGDVTERHVNLMTTRGERVSIYLSAPVAQGASDDSALTAAMSAAEVIVLDLAAEPLRLLPLARRTGRPIWVDVHDYDGVAAFHRPFLEAADAVFCNADRLDDPLGFLHERVDAGASLAVCTLGADGAVAVDSRGVEHRVSAIPVELIDTNGAGDAFFAGVLDAHLAGEPVSEALAAGARAAAVVLRSRHLHPLLDPILG
ncbi:MAG: PfkB family carbohydrate kinase [Candidatus Microbacterium colombiense]|nr:MAG: PfkB family carbohydrate kinase [Microbacterium sp.]